MAKSLRSKWRRKCRAVKRERYGVKELARLKKTLGTEKDADASEIAQLVTVTDARAVKDTVERDRPIHDDEPLAMDVDGKRTYDRRTMRDQYGNYPVWMSARKVSKHKKGRAKNKKATTRDTRRPARRRRNAAKA